jgi:hypothetical protein
MKMATTTTNKTPPRMKSTWMRCDGIFESFYVSCSHCHYCNLGNERVYKSVGFLILVILMLFIPCALLLLLFLSHRKLSTGEAVFV